MKQKYKKRQRRKIPWNSECQLLAVTELGSINNIVILEKMFLTEDWLL